MIGATPTFQNHKVQPRGAAFLASGGPSTGGWPVPWDCLSVLADGRYRPIDSQIRAYARLSLKLPPYRPIMPEDGAHPTRQDQTEALGERSLLAFPIQRLVCPRHKVFERVLFL